MCQRTFEYVYYQELNLPGLKAWDSDASGFPLATAVGADFPEGSACAYPGAKDGTHSPLGFA